MKYAFIEVEKGRFPVRAMCRVLRVSESGFYGWRKRRKEPDHRIPKNETELRAAILRIHRRSRRTYGRPRLLVALRAEGWRIGGKRVGRIMAELGLEGRSGRKRGRKPKEATNPPPSPNLLARGFDVPAPNTVWAGDLTEVQIGPRKIWIAMIADLCSRRVVGLAMANTANAELVVNTMKSAVRKRRPPKGLIFHSDQGCQYSSERFRDQLRVLGIRQSMSRRGNCWDNAPVESFFATLKKELVYTQRWSSMAEFERACAKYVRFYNRDRLHSTLDHRSPTDYEAQLAAA